MDCLLTNNYLQAAIVTNSVKNLLNDVLAWFNNKTATAGGKGFR